MPVAQTERITMKITFSSLNPSSGSHKCVVSTMTDTNNQRSKPIRQKLKFFLNNMCSAKAAKKRLPILKWLPNYSKSFLIQDTIAGITVGLTAIPQGIAYAIVAGLPPEYGLYSGLIGGIVYLFFGSCKDVTIGPTAIMSALISKYVLGYSVDFAILSTFLSGLTILFLGIFQLGFLVEFISQTVISGFVTAAALQISSSQLKALFGLSGSSGSIFLESVTNFVENITTMQLWDSVLGLATIVLLLLLKYLGQECTRTDNLTKQIRWFMSLGRNAVVVVIGITLAVIIKMITGNEPFSLIGDIGGGLPHIKPPAFSSVVENNTYEFKDMVETLGTSVIVVPLISLLEIVAISKSFSGGSVISTTQEMIALGLCNLFGSFIGSMPITGSFTRTAINNASGVQTPVGGVFTTLVILLALSLLTSTFYFIPKPTLAALIIAALFSMLEFEFFLKLWKISKKELVVWLITIATCLCLGLEYGIVAGVSTEALMLLYLAARPSVLASCMKNEKGEVIVVPLPDNVSYCAAEHIRRNTMKASKSIPSEIIIVIDGTNLKKMDTTVASNLMSVVKDLERHSINIMFLNFNVDLENMCIALTPNYTDKFMTAENPLDLLNVIKKPV